MQCIQKLTPSVSVLLAEHHLDLPGISETNSYFTHFCCWKNQFILSVFQALEWNTEILSWITLSPRACNSTAAHFTSNLKKRGRWKFTVPEKKLAKVYPDLDTKIFVLAMLT